MSAGRPARRWRWRDRGGIAALEFGMLAPLFAIMLAATADMGNYVLLQMRLVASVSAGANFAILNAASASSSTSSSCGAGTSGATTCGGWLGTNIAAIVTNVPTNGWANATVVVNNGQTVTSTGGSAATGGTPTNADSCYCPTGAIPSWSWGSAVACGNTCPGGGTAGKYVAITATRSFSPIFPAYTFIASSTVTAGAMAQVQ